MVFIVNGTWGPWGTCDNRCKKRRRPICHPDTPYCDGVDDDVKNCTDGEGDCGK